MKDPCTRHFLCNRQDLIIVGISKLPWINRRPDDVQILTKEHHVTKKYDAIFDLKSTKKGATEHCF